MTPTNEDQKQVLIPIACGSCETETIMIATTLQMFGAIVVLASVQEEDRHCSMIGGFMMRADIKIEDALDFDWDLIVIPGGGR
jgi:putative intracellular protease/amidase